MIINILNGCTEVNLIGGTFRPNRKDFCGYITEKTIKDCHFNKCILGTDGYHEHVGFTTTDFDSAKICEVAIDNSDNVLILMDSHKYGKAALVAFSCGGNVSLLVSDDKLKEEQLSQLLRAGINVCVTKN